MSGQEKYFIPSHLDNVAKFLFWDMDEAIIFITPIFFGIMLNFIVLASICAILALKFWKKIKGSQGAGAVRSLLYWYYPRGIVGLKYTPDSSIKYFIF